MFQNYSQTYAAAITALAGVLVSVLALFHITLLEPNVELVLGNIVTLGGLVWQIAHRYEQGGVTPLGARK